MCLSLPRGGQRKGPLDLLKGLPGLVWLLASVLTRAIWLHLHRRRDGV